jgi:hypothetical protein
MARRSPRHTPGLRIRRDFDPSRFQHRDLAFAFEQALPIIRTSIQNQNIDMSTGPAEARPAARAAGSGAPP